MGSKGCWKRVVYECDRVWDLKFCDRRCSLGDFGPWVFGLGFLSGLLGFRLGFQSRPLRVRFGDSAV